MKKRQVMALILAAALALPNTGVVAGITGVPAIVEASGSNLIDFSGFGGAETPSRTASVNTAKKNLQSAFDIAGEGNDGKVMITENDTKVRDVIQLASGWELLNGDTTLKMGDDNVAKVKYTFPKETVVSGNNWDQDDGIYSAEFDVKFEAVRGITPAEVLEDCKWPALTDKEYKDTAGKESFYWEDDLKSGSSKYGSFSINDGGGNMTVGTHNVDVVFTLKAGYQFSKDDTVNGVNVDVSADAYSCTKTYAGLKVTEQKVENIEWPELKTKTDATPAYGAQVSTIYEVGTVPTSMDSKVTFSLCDKDGAAIGTTKLTVGSNTVKIKAVGKTNYQVVGENNVQFKTVTVNVPNPAMTSVQIKNNADASNPAVIANDTLNITTAKTPAKLVAVDNWNADFSAETNKTQADIYTMNYQWYKNNEKMTGETNPDLSTEEPGEYYCAVSATVKGTAIKDMTEIYSNQPVMNSQKVNVAFSEIATDATGFTLTDGSKSAFDVTKKVPDSTQYGALNQNCEYKVALKGLTNNAVMTLLVKDATGKDVTDMVKDKIIGKAGQIADGKCVYTISVDKGIDAGTYALVVKVTDGNDVVSIADATNLKFTIGKKEIKFDEGKAEIKPVGEPTLAYGDGLDKLPQYAYVAKATATTDESKAIKAINDKISVTMADADKTALGTTYINTTGTKDVAANVELKEGYEKNYALAADDAPVMMSVTSGKGAVNKSYVSDLIINKKKVTLGVEPLEMMKGEKNLPELKITGADFLDDDTKGTGKIEVVDGDDYTLYTKQTEIKNSLKSLPAGEYVAKVKLQVNGSKIANYEVNGDNGSDGMYVEVNTSLTIYDDQHVVGFVTYGDTNFADVKVYHGQAIGTLPTPTRAGYKFIGWYANKDFTEAYDAKAPVTGNVVLYAKWEKVSTETNGGQNSADAVKVGTTTKTSAGTFAVTNASTRTVAYKAASKSAKKVTVPSSVTIKGVSYKVTKIDNNAFKNCKKLTKVSIPSTVTEIGTAAFKGCKKLTSVTIPKNVKKIGKEAFSGCSKLKKVTIKSTKIKSVGKNAFKGIARKSAIKTPKSKKAAYKKLLKKSGYKKTVK